MTFIKNGELQDIKIINALKEAVCDYENGAISEVRDLLVDIADSIDEWEDLHEETYNRT